MGSIACLFTCNTLNTGPPAAPASVAGRFGRVMRVLGLQPHIQYTLALPGLSANLLDEFWCYQRACCEDFVVPRECGKLKTELQAELEAAAQGTHIAFDHAKHNS